MKKSLFQNFSWVAITTFSTLLFSSFANAQRGGHHHGWGHGDRHDRGRYEHGWQPQLRVYAPIPPVRVMPPAIVITPPAYCRPRYYDNYRTNELYRNGYENGYYDGIRAGKTDWDRGLVYRNGRDSYYNGDAYRNGYSDGFYEGYDDGYNRRNQQYQYDNRGYDQRGYDPNYNTQPNMPRGY
jgi:hypothetical protein